LGRNRVIFRLMKLPQNALSLIYNSLFPTEKPAETETATTAEYTVDELARAAGTTVRNVRAYQDRGLLPPPERRGRTGIYSDLHLSRLRLIGNLLQRGYSLSNIKEMVGAWEQGSDLSQLLGLEKAITTPWTNEVPSHVSQEELLQMFEGALTDENMKRAIELGLIQPVRNGYRLNQPRLLNAGAELVRLGVPISELFDILQALRGNVERVAQELVGLAVPLIDHYGGQVPPNEDLPQLANLIWRLRPLALIAVESEVQRALEAAANKFLTERVADLFRQPETSPQASNAGQLPTDEPKS